MIKFVSFVSEIRASALLGAAVFLTACGGAGMAEESTSAETRPHNQVAAQVVTGTAAEGAVQDAAAAADVPSFAIAGYAHLETAAPGPGDSLVARTGPSPSPSPVAAAPATTYNYYVSSNGSDSNPGTSSRPFRTIQKAAGVARPSTTVFVAPGTYYGGFKTTVNGTEAGRIYFVSTTKWGAKIVPPASSSNDAAWDNRGNYVDIVGFEVDGSRPQSGKRWLQGIYNGGSYDVIRSNRVHHIATTSPCTSAGGSAIGVDSYFRGVKGDVIGNLVHDIGPAGCTFVQGIYISTSGSVKNNVVYRVAEAAIHLWHDANNVIITNNTVAASNSGIIVGGGDFYFTSGPADHIAVYNNIVYDNKYGISEQGRTGTHNSYRNNLVVQNGSNWTLKNGLTHTGTVTSAPYFASYSRTGTPNLHLSASSPAIGRGTSAHAHPTDFDGRARNTSTGFDIGAYQH